MTKETLNKAIGLSKRIDEYEGFLKAYNAPYINAIKASNFIGMEPDNKCLILSNEPELNNLIREYVKNKIDSLKAELDELN